MQLLVLESSDDDPVQKSAVKGIGAVTTTVTKTAPANAAEARLNRTTTNNTGLERMQTLEQTSTINSTSTATSMLRPNAPNLNDNDAKVMYPFRIKHLGKAEVYTLYAPSASSRDKWCDKIIEAKTRYAAALFAQNAEPFRLRVIADSAFAYDNSMIYQQRALIPIYGTPLDRSVRDLEHLYGSKPRPPPVCRAQVNCAVSFTSYGKLLIAIGTDYGVYISEASNARGWSRVSRILFPILTRTKLMLAGDPNAESNTNRRPRGIFALSHHCRQSSDCISSRRNHPGFKLSWSDQYRIGSESTSKTFRQSRCIFLRYSSYERKNLSLL